MTEQATTQAPAPTANNGAPRATIENFQSLVEHNMRAAPELPAARPANDNARPVVPVQDPPPAQEFADEPQPEAEGEEAIADLLQEKIHGRTGREILEAIKNGSLLEELLDAVKGTYTLDREQHPVTLREAFAGYQRNMDYTRGKQEVRAAQQRAADTMRTVNAMLEGWGDGDNVLRDFQRLGKMEGFRKAALKFATQEVQNRRWQRENPDAFRLHQELQSLREQQEAMRRQLRAQPDPDTQRRQQEQNSELSRMLPAAFARHKLQDLPQVRNMFRDAFVAIYEDGTDLQVAVETAAASTAELLAQMATTYQTQLGGQGNPAPAKNPSPLPGRTAAPAATGRPSVYQKSMSPGDMESYLKDLRRKGR